MAALLWLLIGCGAAVKPAWLKAILFGGGVVAGGVGVVQRKSFDMAREYDSVVRGASALAFTKTVETTLGLRGNARVQWGEAEVEPFALPAGPSVYPFDSILEEATGIALLGNSGSGKSCVAQYLIGLMGPSQILVLDPHDDGKTWGSLPVIHDFAEIVAQLSLLLNELDHRRQLRKQGKPFDNLVIICDEWPAVRDYCQMEKNVIADRFVLRMGSEARKFGIMCVFASQSGNVEAMGMKGKGDFLQNFTLIRLGKIAVKYAKNLPDRSILPEVQGVAYPAMINDELSIHPTHGHYHQCKKGQPPANLRPLQALPLSIDVVGNIGYTEESATDEVEFNQEMVDKLLRFATPRGWVKARDIKGGVREFQKITTSDIRHLFGILASEGLGELQGEGDGLQFRVK